MSGDHSVRASNPTWVHADTSGSQRVAEHFISGRAVLAGDAARVFSSAAGHGVHSAIEDALSLGWKLALTISGAAVPSRLGTYDTERRGHANDVIRKTQWVQCFLKLRGGLRKVLWGLLYLVGKHLRSIGSIASKQAEKLVTDYGKSALSRGDSTDTPPRTRAGLHASETACRTGGRPSGLLEIIRGSEADLLLFSGSTADFEAVNSLRAIEQCVACLREHLRVHYVFGSQAYASDAGFGEDDPRVIVDGLESLQSAFGIREPELVYIRPDGYIGLRTQDLHPHRLCVYLGQIYRAIHDETPASPLLQ